MEALIDHSFPFAPDGDDAGVFLRDATNHEPDQQNENMTREGQRRDGEVK